MARQRALHQLSIQPKGEKRFMSVKQKNYTEHAFNHDDQRHND